jgi:hypothetical protein
VNVATGTPAPAPTPSAATTLTLAPPWPNPVRATQSAAAATIEFALPASGTVSVDLFDASGRVVTRLPSRWFPAGSHRTGFRKHQNVVDADDDSVAEVRHRAARHYQRAD